MIRTNKELADWIFDRVSQSQYEEIGSLDTEDMNGHEVTIQVAEINYDGVRYCDVFVDCGVIYSNFVHPNTPYETILKDIEENNVELNTKG